ncbi:MAG: PAS domain S-box protein [Alphaproteobacteria bacterium]
MRILSVFNKTSFAPVKIALIVIFMAGMGFFSVQNTNKQTEVLRELKEDYFNKNKIINDIYEHVENTQFLIYKLYTHYAFLSVNLEQREGYKGNIIQNLKGIDDDILKIEKMALSDKEKKLANLIIENKNKYKTAIDDVLNIIDIDVSLAYMYQNTANEMYLALNTNVFDIKAHFNNSFADVLTEAGENASRTVTVVIVFALSAVLLAFFVGLLRKDNYNLEKLVDERTAKLKENEQNLAITLNSIGDGIIATDINGLITRMNPVAERLTGYKLEEALGKNLEDIFKTTGNKSGKVNPVQEVIATGSKPSSENRAVLVSRDGIEYQIADSAAPIKDETGTIKGVVLVFRDVTSEYLIQENLMRIKKAVEASGDAIGMATCQGEIFYQNQAFTQMLGYSTEEIKNVTVPQLYKDKDRAYEMFASVINGKSWVGEIEIVKRNGEGLFVLLRADVIKNDAGEIVGIIGVHTDITEQKKAQEQTIRMLEKEIAAREQQQNFVSMVSHEFKTPLSIIDSSAQKIIRKINTIEITEVAERMERVRHNVGRLNNLVESTLSLSKLDAGQLSINPSVNDLKDVIHSMVRDIKNYTSERVINFKNEGNTICSFDPERLGLVVNNLLSNALKYSTAEVNVLCFEDKDYVRFAVADKGVGISKENLPKVGEKFFRADNTKNIPGTGVGLYLVKNIIEKHQGYLKIESEKGVGTTIIVSIPKNIQQKENVDVDVES